MLKDDEAKRTQEEKERLEMAARLRIALDAAPSYAAVTNACGVSQQSATGWLKTGRISKKHLPTIAKISGCALAWLIDGTLPMRAQDEGQPNERVSNLLDYYKQDLASAPTELREAIEALVLSYEEDPKKGSRVARAIKDLLSYGHD